MYIEHRESGELLKIVIEPLLPDDYKQIPKSRYWFNWRSERAYQVYKLRPAMMKDILGLMSVEIMDDDQRIEIRLLAVSKENRGKEKIYNGIAGNLIAYACRESVKLFGEQACVSLIPKTELEKHYMNMYGMSNTGKCVYIEGAAIIALLEKYEL